jgi:hypothetical protein
MVSFQQHLLVLFPLFIAIAPAQKLDLRPDDPLRNEPPPRQVTKAVTRNIDDLYDFVRHSFVTVRQFKKKLKTDPIPSSLDVNTLGEVLNSAWYTNRHGQQRMTLEELRRGPGNSTPPRTDGPWRVVAAKSDGVTPGFTIQDPAGNRYLIKLDPPANPELSSGADMIGSKIFYALGYFTPENYVSRLDPAKLEVDPKATYTDLQGRKRPLTLRYIQRLLRQQPREPGSKTYRVLASRFLAGQPLGPYRYQGQRLDDPNDIWPHEDRRSLRALQVFCAWLNHTDSRAINSLDMLVKDGDLSYIRHHLIDFGSAFGSDSIFPKEISRGHLYDVEAPEMGKRILSFGLRAPDWERVAIPKLRGIGRFEAIAFRAREWKPAYPNPAFLRMREEDAVWAAAQVAAFTDADIAALVSTASYTDPASTAYMTQVLCKRRDAIASAYLQGALYVQSAQLERGELIVRTPARKQPKITWVEAKAEGPTLPNSFRSLPNGSIVTARIEDAEQPNTPAAQVHLRQEPDGFKVVAITHSQRSRSSHE